MRWKLESKSLLAFSHNMNVETGTGEAPNCTPHSSFTEHSTLLSKVEKYAPSPSPQVRHFLPDGQMQTGSLWLHLLFSKSLGFPLQVGVTLHKTKMIGVENRNKHSTNIHSRGNNAVNFVQKGDL